MDTFEIWKSGFPSAIRLRLVYSESRRVLKAIAVRLNIKWITMEGSNDCVRSYAYAHKTPSAKTGGQEIVGCMMVNSKELNKTELNTP